MTFSFKKVLCTAAALAVLSTTAVYADGTDPSVTIETTAVNGVPTERVIVRLDLQYDGAADQPVSIYISKPDDADTSIWADQDRTAEGGSVRFEFAVNPAFPAGEYSYEAAVSETEVKTGSFEVADVVNLQKASAVIQSAANESEVISALSAFRPYLNLQAYNEIDKQALYQYIYNERGSLDGSAESLFRALRQGTILLAIQQNTGSSTQPDGGLYGLDILGTDADIVSIYQTEFSASLRNIVNEGIRSLDFSSVTEFNSIFTELVKVNRITSSTSDLGKVRQYLVSYADDLGLELSDMNNTYYTEIIRELVKGEAHTKEQLQADFAAACAKYKKTAGSGGGASGSGGSGAGYSQMPAVTQPVSPTNLRDTAFADMGGYEWALDAVYALKQIGAVNGKTETEFDPGASVTREEFVKMVLLSLSLFSDDSAPAQFIDIPADSWCIPYVNKAVSLGIINGYDAETFGFGMPVTRQDMATIAFRAFRFVYDSFDGQERAAFSDSADIADYAQQPVWYMNNLGVINGYPDGSFRPDANANRAEAAQMIYAMLNIIEEE